jgi:hypothetical protein
MKPSQPGVPTSSKIGKPRWPKPMYPVRKALPGDLAALRKQLEKAEPDSERVTSLIHRLGEATVKISERSDKQQDKLKQLGEALIEAGDEDSDEAEDTEAAANPKRRGGRPPKAKNK